MSHTPTPWAWLPDEGQFIIDASHHVLAEVPCQAGNPDDGAFIVRACNSHNALVEALTASTEALNAWLHQYAPDHCEADDVERYGALIAQYGTLGYVARQLKMNRNALALAQKEHP